MADQPERTPHLRITRSSIVVQGSPSEPPRSFARDIDCDSGSVSASGRTDPEATTARGERMPSRYGDENGRRRR